MLRITTLFSLLVGLSCAIQAKNISLNLQHFVGEASMFVNEEYQSLEGTMFKINRCQYYISEIQLVHDGGQTTDLTDVYLLVNGNQNMYGSADMYELGEYDIENLEAVNFFVGVPEGVNHDDPSSWGAGHPLAPQNPSMHWGWAAGYRFIALEGRSDPEGDGSLQAIFEFHAVSDSYYTPVSVETEGIDEGDDLTIALKVDYNKMLEGVNLAGVVHGTGADNAQIMNNIEGNNVFVEAPPSLPQETFEVEGTSLNISGESANEMLSATTNLNNILDENISLDWTIINSTVPEEWTVEICGNTECSEEENGTFDVASGNYEISTMVYPNETAGEGQITVQVQNPLTEEVVEITWIVVVTQTEEDNTSIANVEGTNAINVFPNPTASKINIQYDFSNVQNLRLQIVDVLGKVIFEQELWTQESQLSLEIDWASGLYFCQFLSDEKILGQSKLLVTK